ncbi:MAG TPA: hypothetical protein VG602_00040, partial [Actinomycetota bacterium]|nr:hypothetical protein [Actinomycetota bacterium]
MTRSAAALVLFALTAAACGGETEPRQPATPAAVTPATTPAPPQPSLPSEPNLDDVRVRLVRVAVLEQP